jgi:hypothetical protein
MLKIFFSSSDSLDAAMVPKVNPIKEAKVVSGLRKEN